MRDRWPVWFERPVLPDLVAEVREHAEILGPATVEDPFAGLAAAHAAVVGAAGFDHEHIARAPKLRVIARTGIGVDRVDIAEANRRGIAVCNAPDAPTVSTAEHAVALMLAVAKNLESSEAALRAGKTGLYAAHRGIELDGKTLGLVGYGRIARRVAGAARGLGMRISAFDPHLDPDAFGDATRAGTLPELLAEADVVSLHVPLTPDTARSFGTDEFAAMRDGAILINTARGGLVDHDALLHAIDAGKLFGAGLDVTDPEPLPPDHALLHRPNVLVTPHVASGTADGKRRLFLVAFRQAIQVLDGEHPPHVVNPEVLAKQETNT
jgi:phosphoglycerate dehydrogenase-like enzyme